jgi:hypothetical protein
MRTAVTIAAAALALQASAARKYIFTGWDVNDASPSEILAHAGKFDRTGCDGVGVKLDPSCSTDVRKRLHIAESPRWSGYDATPVLSVCREFRKHPSLRHSFFFVNFAPRKARLSWMDDAAWELYADNAATAARLAKESGFEGLIADFEDYWKKKQFRRIDGDPSWEESKALARRRGREVFTRIFEVFPEIVILSFQLLTTDMAYAKVSNPLAYMEEKRDLWPSFVNGMLDAMPPTAKIVDGNESFAYGAKASRLDFYRSVRDQTIGVLPLVAEENRAKYRAQISVSHGLYMDSYAGCPTNSAYYMAPVRGKRITHFEENLRQATLCSDEYVWFWGEKGFYVDWPADLKEKSGDVWRSSGGGKWRRKYFEGSWGRIRPWKDTIDGDVDLLMRGIKDPSRCVADELLRQMNAGKFSNLFKGTLAPLEKATNGNVSARICGLDVDGWYGMVVEGRGDVLRGNVRFQYRGKWRWNLGSVQFDFERKKGSSVAGEWRSGRALVRIPHGATDAFVVLEAGVGEKSRKVEFRNLKVFRMK